MVSALPRKDRDSYNEYMQKYMRERRAKKKKRLKEARLELGKDMPNIPKLRKLLGVGLGKPKKKKRKRG